MQLISEHNSRKALLRNLKGRWNVSSRFFYTVDLDWTKALKVLVQFGLELQNGFLLLLGIIKTSCKIINRKKKKRKKKNPKVMTKGSIIERILPLRPQRGGVSSCETYVFRFSQLGQCSMWDVHNYAVLIIANVFFKTLMQVVCMWDFQKTWECPPSHLLSSKPFWKTSKTLLSTECAFLQCTQLFLMTVYVNLGDVDSREFLLQYK